MSVVFDDDMIRKIRQAAMRGVVMGTEMLLTEGNRLITEGPKTGRIYRRRGIAHQASAPGEPPATDTGHLVQSGRTEFDFDNLSGTANWSTEYAAKLELGTARIAPRPYASVAVQNKRDEITVTILEQVRSVL
jgi:hypothetical protein